LIKKIKKKTKKPKNEGVKPENKIYKEGGFIIIQNVVII